MISNGIFVMAKELCLTREVRVGIKFLQSLDDGSITSNTIDKRAAH